jgi:hypothetical protein
MVRISYITLRCNFPCSTLQLITNLVVTMNEKRKDYEPKIILRQAKISVKPLTANNDNARLFSLKMYISTYHFPDLKS